MPDDTSVPNQSEPLDLASLLDLEPLEADLFRYTDTRLPPGARGIYGGQVISQAIVAATKTIDRVFHLHSLHCYFVSNALPATIYYNVESIRNGRSYSTRAVRAVQDGKTVFAMLCSFQKPEPWQPAFRSPIPKVPAPEECEILQAYYRRCAEEHTDVQAKHYFISRARVRERSPIEVRFATEDHRDGYYVQCHWMRAISLPECDIAYQKAVLGYISDIMFLEVGGNALGLRESSEEGPDVAAFATTIDHSIWYFSDDFDCSGWLLLESRVPQVGLGRAIVHRRVFTQDGTLIANFSQEGVMRAKVQGPKKPKKVEIPR